jgi:RNA polymerase sigma-70 factor (ECF subfamily)
VTLSFITAPHGAFLFYKIYFKARAPPLLSEFTYQFRKGTTMSKNPYTLRTELIEGIIRYYVSFRDGQAIQRETEISRPIYLEFLRNVKIERNQRRSDERHIEQSALTERTLQRRALNTPKSAEDAALENIRNELLERVIDELPETQWRRFVLYHDFGLTYEQISTIEGCSSVSVFRSVSRAEEKIKIIFEKQG